MTLAAEPVAVAVFGVSAGAVFGLLALGLVLIYRTTGVLNFAHWGVGLIGIAFYAVVTRGGLPPVGAAILSTAVSAAAGAAAYRFVIRRVPRSRQIIVILMAIAFAQLLSSIAAMVVGFETFTTLPGWLPAKDIRFGGGVIGTDDLIIVGTAVAIAAGFFIWFKVSRTGKALRAVAQNREAAMLAGIDDVKYSTIAWAIGSALAALPLLLTMPHRAGDQGLVNTFDLTPLGTILIPAFGAALVGGLVNMPMALAGGLVFGLAQELLILAPAPYSEGPVRSVVAAGLIVVLLLLRTERFFATRQELEALET